MQPFVTFEVAALVAVGDQVSADLADLEEPVSETVAEDAYGIGRHAL